MKPFDIFCALHKRHTIEAERYPFWWPGYGCEEVIFGTMLTQQAKFIKVEEALNNLKNAEIFTLEKISTADVEIIKHHIRPSGFYNQKSTRLKQICSNIIGDFGSFANFSEKVDRHWLLSQKGIGFESADDILCYACKRPVMVSDTYTARLLIGLDFDFEGYEDMNTWLQEGIDETADEIREFCKSDFTDAIIFALFHGLIVNYMKDKPKKPTNLTQDLF